MASEPVAITELIAHVRAGSADATNEIVERLYHRFRYLAHRRRDRPDLSLGTSDLTNGTLLRLLKSDEIVKAANTNQIFRAFARSMWQLISDHRRTQPTGRREELDDFADYVREVSQLDVLALHEALSALAADHPRRAAVLELHYFGGYDLKDIPEILTKEYPEVLGGEGATVGLRTVERDHQYALAWVDRFLTAGRP